MLLPGINFDQYNAEKHHIISMASCTTNALAPVVKVLMENFGIQAGFFSTVHAYTNTQSLTDQPMRDRVIPGLPPRTSSLLRPGRPRHFKFIWPDLKITGKAYRIPVRTGSIAEVNAIVGRPTTAEEINDVFRKAAATAPLKGIMGVLEGEWASSRIVADPHSSIIDLPLTQVMEGTLVSGAAWYDNEMGYSTRLAEVAAQLAQ